MTNFALNKTITIAIVGNPNSGKTSLFNKLTGSNQQVGNWPGVTVDKKIGWFDFANTSVTVVDLPGVYSMDNGTETSLDEKIAADYILSGQADLIINILDATNLKRNLYLTTQLIEMQVPMVVAVNMLDLATKRNIQINLDEISEMLGCPVISLVSTKGHGVESLKELICQKKLHKIPKIQHYEPFIENSLLKISNFNYKQTHISRTTSINLLAKNYPNYPNYPNYLENNSKLTQLIIDLQKQLSSKYAEDCELLIAEQRYKLVEKICSQCCKYPTNHRATVTQYIDRIVLNKYLGIPIFFLMIYLVFEISMNLGEILQPIFDISSKFIFIDTINYLGNYFKIPWSVILITNGIGIGLNTIAKFIPQIGLLFLCLTWLEDSGYMARAAFVMDRFMQLAGLPGNAFVPLILGFGCNVPAVMATRILFLRDRIITCMMLPFMSCTARLAIFVIFAETFFPKYPGLILFLLYLSGILIALITGVLLKKFCFGESADNLVLELPIYHSPIFNNLLTNTWLKLRGFVWRAGKIILPICLLLGVLNSFQFNGKIASNADDSIIASVGKAMTPIFTPIGITTDNWPATVGLINGALAKEVVIGSLNTLYAQQKSKLDLLSDSELDKSSQNTLRSAFVSKSSAFAYLLFVLLYIPCISTIGALVREIGKIWSYISTIWSITLAYTISVIFYQLANFSTNPAKSSLWIISLILIQISTFVFIKLKTSNNLNNKINNKIGMQNAISDRN